MWDVQTVMSIKCCLIAVVCFIFLLLFVGCSKNLDWTDISGQYNNPTYKFSVAFPGGWVVQATPDCDYLGAIYHKGQARISIKISDANYPEEPDEVDLTKFRVRISRGNASIDGLQARWVIFEDSEVNSECRFYKVYNVQKENQVYYLSFAAENAESFFVLGTHFGYMVRSLEFQD